MRRFTPNLRLPATRPPRYWARWTASAQPWPGSAAGWMPRASARRLPRRRSPWAACSSIWPWSRTSTSPGGCWVGRWGTRGTRRTGTPTPTGSGIRPPTTHPSSYGRSGRTPRPALAPRSPRYWPTVTWGSWRGVAGRTVRPQPAAHPDRPDRGVRAARRSCRSHPGVGGRPRRRRSAPRITG